MVTVHDASGRPLIGVPPGTLLIDALAGAGLAMEDSSCGRAGVCGKCLARVRCGSTEEWQQVLACQTPVLSDLQVDLPDSGTPRKYVVLEAASPAQTPPQPAIRKLFVESLSHGLALAWEQLCARANILPRSAAPPDVYVARQLAAFIQAKESFTAVLFEGKIIGLEQGDTSRILCGMAFDIGTTTVVGYLLNLFDGRPLATVSALNPQVRHGADVITRVTMAEREPGGLERLREAIITCINHLIEKAVTNAGVTREAIYDIVLVGNPCMQLLFFGIQPAGLGKAPYQPIFREQLTLPASAADVKANRLARLTWLPAVAGFVGADTVGVLLAHPLHDRSGVTLALDIGTNGEIVLACRGELWACSTAAGPAFEGTAMSSGIRAQSGAIDKVWIGERGLEYHVIDGAHPRGICGSGVVDAVAALLDLGLINESGRLLRPDDGQRFTDRFTDRDGSVAFSLVSGAAAADGKEIVVTQNDVRQLQLAKAAITTGLLMLLDRAQVSLPEVTRVLLAGAFGVYLRLDSIRRIGLLPTVLCDKISPIGNAAGAGAQIALLSQGSRQLANEMAPRIRYVELAGTLDFSDRFVEELSFPSK